MVAAAKKEREAVERKNDQLRAQITDTEMLLASQQDQLSELKSVMQRMNRDREEAEIRTNPSTTAPSSPGPLHQHDQISRMMGPVQSLPDTPTFDDISPGPSTSFSHLIRTVCRTDIQAYDDFHTLTQISKCSKPPSRVGSGSYGGLSVIGLASFTGQANHSHSQSNGSTPSLSGIATHNSSPNGGSSPGDSGRSYAHLKETRFYKRTLAEDVEPTLRLDIAPGISWLNRRAVLSSICEGGLVVEPMPALNIKYPLPCSLCGERRNGEENPRTHRFRTSDNDNAQRFPLCVICLEKMRSCCEFVGYLRLVVDGHVRVGDDEEIREAWEETVRLRERMFWSRMGGGVIPTFTQAKPPEKEISADGFGTSGSPSKNADLEKPEVQVHSPSSPEMNSVAKNGTDLEQRQDPFVSNVKRASIGNTVISLKERFESAERTSNNNKEADETSTQSQAKENKPNNEQRNSVGDSSFLGASQSRSRSRSRSTSPSNNNVGNNPRLSVTIPGSFEH